VTTAVARVAEETAVTPTLPDVLTQFVDLGVPYAAGEQGRLLAAGIAALTLTTAERGDPPIPVGDPAGPLSTRQLGALGRATEALVGSIDTSVGAAFRTPDSIFFGDRVASGWAVRLTLIVAVVPFALGVLDLLVRSRRRRLPLTPAIRALRARVLFWLYVGLLAWIGGLAGIFPTGAALPLPPYSSVVTDWPFAGVALLTVALVVGWLVVRRRLVRTGQVAPEERLAGYTIALAWLAVLAVVIGVVKPYGLVFVLPSLYAWLWLPLRTRIWARATLFAVGLLGPIVGLAVLASEIGLGLLDTALYLVDLVTVGYVSASSVLFALAWAAAAGQLGALALGRYGPYAGGAEPPPPGIVRNAVRAVAARARSRGYTRAR
jgi:hypothetical protein